MSEFAEDEWMPSEGEQKLLEARRERQDKISKIMGGYLLKGYKMLATTCPVCSTILMRTRPPNGTTADGVDYCINCMELDSDVSKDDPLLDETAARSQVLEKQLRLEQKQPTKMATTDEKIPLSSSSSLPPAAATTPDPQQPSTTSTMLVSMRMGRPDTSATQIESCTAFGTLRKCDPPRVSSDESGARVRCAMPSICPTVKVKDPSLCHQSSLDSCHHHQQQQQAGTSTILPPSQSNPQQHLNISMTHHHYNYQHHHQQNQQHATNLTYDDKLKDSLAVVALKLDWATEQLKKSADVEHTKQLVSLIGACAEAIKSLKSAYHHVVADKIEEST